MNESPRVERPVSQTGNESAELNDKRAEIAARLSGVSREAILESEAKSFDDERDSILTKMDETNQYLDDFLKKSKSERSVTQMWHKVFDMDTDVKYSRYSEQLLDSEGVILKMAESRADLVFHDMSDRLKNDKEFVLQLLSVRPKISDGIGGGISWLSETMHSDPDIIRAAMKTSPVAAFSCAPQSMRDDPDFILEAFDAIDATSDRDLRDSKMANILTMVSKEVADDIIGKAAVTGGPSVVSEFVQKNRAWQERQAANDADARATEELDGVKQRLGMR